MGNHLRHRALGGHLAGMVPKLRKRGSANSIGEKDSEGKRGQRCAN